ncbi:MAG TPA: hypothetical protein VEY09_12620 [Pyrinomonadaceae bacterium]|nr:hypothetical protein [Pyrinomonadaceae bacterium]
MKRPEELLNIEAEAEREVEERGDRRQKKPFVEPAVSEPEDVLKATTFFFQATLTTGAI